MAYLIPVFIYSFGGVAVSRTIIHCDADCFFAAIEMRDNPQLHGRPIAVGGRPDRRGVISTCNYPARQFGVRSAMASAYALRLCPGLIILPHRMTHYRDASQKIMAIFHQFTDLVEPLSLDEAFLDVTDAVNDSNSARAIAEQIREQVVAQLGITVSAGIAPNKFLAKVASDWRKPDGLFEIKPEQVAEFVARLPVSCIPGVGKVTGERLAQLQVKNCGDLLRFDERELCERFGQFGSRLYHCSRGIDSRLVRVERQRKSVSVEQTFAQDMTVDEACETYLTELIARLQVRIDKLTDQYGVGKAFVKVKFADFSSTTLERANDEFSYCNFAELIREAASRHDSRVRLLGVGVRLTEQAAAPVAEVEQLGLFGG
ncbi:DNA polymerase IV [Gilvimarinus agarilyticus]|uniref:DNA polymerase IV n=1 Tax=Gilvimarinus agarilyticus TaxID=679259 RepID=UPI0006981081|nr:DNA polymerase IV [Gilvimarinus agarilyticus]